MARITEVSPADEAAVVDIICTEIDNAQSRITSEASWDRLAQFFYEALLGRHTLSAAVVLAWADAGHPAADRAVRLYAAEMVDQGRDSELLVQVKAYIVKTLLRPTGTGLAPTRSGGIAAPSVAYFASLAMKKKGHKLGERQINRILLGSPQAAGGA